MSLIKPIICRNFLIPSSLIFSLSGIFLLFILFIATRTHWRGTQGAEIEQKSKTRVVNRREGGKADLTSCRCARSCRSGRRGGRAPSGGCHSPGFPRTPASSWTPASRRRKNPPTENPRNKPKRKAGSRGGSVLGLGRRRATKDSMGNSGILRAGESNTCVVAARTREKSGEAGLGLDLR